MALSEDIAVLQQLPLLGVLDPEALRLVAFAGESRQFAAGDRIFAEGDVADGGYVVMSGSVELSSGYPVARVSAGAGSLIGELALFLDGRRPATATAVAPTSTLKITRQVFRRVLDEFPDSAARLHASLSERTLGVAAELDGVRAALQAIDRH